jgi:hypothetical protein
MMEGHEAEFLTFRASDIEIKKGRGSGWEEQPGTTASSSNLQQVYFT